MAKAKKTPARQAVAAGALGGALGGARAGAAMGAQLGAQRGARAGAANATQGIIDRVKLKRQVRANRTAGMRTGLP